MKFAKKYPMLDCLFGAYFNQDWCCDYDTPEAVISDFAQAGDKNDILETIVELQILLKEEHTKSEWYKLMSDGFGCAYSLQLRNIEPIEWLKKVLKQLEAELVVAEKKENNIL